MQGLELHLLQKLGQLLLGCDAIELQTIGLPPEYVSTDCFFLELPDPLLLLADHRELLPRPLRRPLPIFHITFSI